MSTEPTTQRSFCIRQLPIPAKLVISCFLLAVGGGYSAAMVQLHLQDSRSGEMMPTLHDVVLKFTGKKWFETSPPKAVSKLEKLVMGPIEGAPWNGSGSMAKAFFANDGGDYKRMIKEAPESKAHLDLERNGEREAVTLWINTPDDARRKAYEADKLLVPEKEAKTITKDYVDPDGGIHIKKILTDRCARCHAKDGAQSAWPLENYEQLAKHLVVPPTVNVKEGGDWVKIEEPIGIEKLTQSTHAHLLSFAMLFALTGLVFALTSYPTVVRCVLGPWVLLAVVADVSLWWAARLSSDWGPYFAMGVIGTGGAAGAGLAAQIVLSLWNMYGMKGKFVLALLAVAIGFGGWTLYMEKIKPGLKDKQDAINAKAQPEKKAEESQPAAKQDAATAKQDPAPAKQNPDGKNVPVATVKMSPIERVLQFPTKGENGMDLPLLSIPFKGALENGTIQEGGMVRAFFDKDSAEYSKAKKDKEALMKLEPERHGELEALRAWIRLTDVDRRKSYEADAFDLPTTLAGKPFTKDYLSAGKVKVKTLIGDRCARCHAEGTEVEKYPLENYNQIQQLLQPAK